MTPASSGHHLLVVTGQEICYSALHHIVGCWRRDKITCTAIRVMNRRRRKQFTRAQDNSGALLAGHLFLATKTLNAELISSISNPDPHHNHNRNPTLILLRSLSRSSSGSSSSSRNEHYLWNEMKVQWFKAFEIYLGGIIALLLQDHRTMSLKSVCSNQ